MKNLAAKIARKLGYVPQYECKAEQSRADMFLELSLKYAEMIKEMPALEENNKMLSVLYERFQNANAELRSERDELLKDIAKANNKIGYLSLEIQVLRLKYEAMKKRRRKSTKKKPDTKKRRAA